MLLVRSYRTFAPLPVSKAPSAVCFCGTLLTVTRTGRYPASLVFRKPGLSSGQRPATAYAYSPLITSLIGRASLFRQIRRWGIWGIQQFVFGGFKLLPHLFNFIKCLR